MIEYGKLLIDFGLVVLVWVVHFAIYPGFRYFQINDLKKWHLVYTKGISYVVAPLMLAQLGLAIYMAVQITTLFVIGNIILVLATWLITFIWAIPLHNAIDQKDHLDKEFSQLMKVNLVRGIVWSFIFLWTLYIMVY